MNPDSPTLIPSAATLEEDFLKRVIARDQMKEFCKNPLVMARAEGMRYWDAAGREWG